MKASCVGLLLIANLVAACGGESDKPPIVARREPEAGRGDRAGNTAAGKGGRGGSSGGGAGMDAMEVGPSIEFTKPEAASDPNADTLVTTREVSVGCKVTARSKTAGVDRGTVKISLQDPRDTKKQIESPATAEAEDLFVAKFVVSELPNGPLSFTCSAKDLSSDAATGSARLDTLLDLGPTLSLGAPLDGTPVALKSPLTIRFSATPAPLTDGDEQADVSEVELKVLGKVFETRENATKPGEYTASVEFNDTTLFNPTPTSADILVRAKNKRKPAVARELRANIKVDGAGPSITIDEPKEMSIKHGKVTMRLILDDASGVKLDGIQGRVSTSASQHTYTSWTKTADKTYETTLNTTDFPSDLNELTINFTVSDIVDNTSIGDVTILLDDHAPILSLDPPWIRDYHEVSGTKSCTRAFDPVGASPDDGSWVTAAARYRVYIEDETNKKEGAALYHAGVDPQNVVLYVQRDRSVPFLINNDNDPECDEINRRLDLPEEQRPVVWRQMDAVSWRGSEWYTKNSAIYDATSSKHMTSCPMDPNGSTVGPETVCPGSELRRVILSRLEIPTAAIYALNPTNGSMGECTGTTWALPDVVGSGWACLAVRAEDRVHNVGISPPLRVCFGPDACDPAAMPTCVANDCTAPPERLPANDILLQR